MSKMQQIKSQAQIESSASAMPTLNRDRLAVVVLGMHRSGTSAMAGVLSMLGIGLPSNLLTPKNDNERGFFESEFIMQAHERLFAALGTSWSELSDIEDVAGTDAGEAFIAEVSAYLEAEFERSPKLVLKDPRMCRLMPIWLHILESLNADVLAIHIVRNPLAVAASLQNRNQFAPGRSLLIWLDHVLRAERSTRGYRRQFVGFENLLADWRDVVADLKKISGIKARLGVAKKVEIETFLSRDLSHYDFKKSDVMDDDSLPEWLAETYDLFDQCIQTGEKPDVAALNEAWMAYDKAAQLFGAMISDHTSHIRQQAEVIGRAKSLEIENSERILELERQVEAQKRAAQEEKDRSDTAFATLEKHSLAELAELNAALSDKVELVEALRSEIQQLAKNHAEEIYRGNEAFADLEQHALAEANELKSALSDKVALVETLQSEIQQLAEDHAEEIKRGNEVFAELEQHALAEANELKSALSDKVALVEALRSEILQLIEDHAEEIDRGNQAFSELEQHTKVQINELKAEVSEKQALVKAHAQDIENRDAKLASQKERVTTLENAINDSHQSLRDAESSAIRYKDNALKAQRRADELSQFNAYLETSVRELEKTVLALRNSTSWKMTAPVRKLKSVGRHNRRAVVTPAARSTIPSKSSDEPDASPVLLRQADVSGDTDLTEAAKPIEPRSTPIDIIVPVYRGLEITKACVESVLASDPGVAHEIILIDDCSPEPDVSAYIASLEGQPGVTVLRNESNLGFVATVNRGMRLHPDRDIVLLNSDTEVRNDWLKRLRSAAYSHPRISSVTPFSNNATICSYPKYCDENALPVGLTLEETDRLFADANPGKTVKIPTAVGFCMFIRRDSLEDVGLFDEEAFGKGYGEENDFCLRSEHAGWHHVLAADVFVYHKGGVSFLDAAGEQQRKAADVIRNRWPDYFTTVARHVAADPERPFRLAATALRYKSDPRPVILHITHAYGGGVERQINDLKALNEPYALFLTLRPEQDGRVRLESPEHDGVSVVYDIGLDGKALEDLLRDFGLDRIHLHHTLRYPDELMSWIKQTGVPFDFTVHDYFSVCPRIHLGGTDGSYCGEPDDAGCNDCIKRDFPVFDGTISEYRKSRAWMVEGAERVIAPSQDTAMRMSRYFPDTDIQVVPHTSDNHDRQQPLVPDLAGSQRLRVLLLGVMAPHKGQSVLLECVSQCAKDKLPIEFHLLGQLQAENPDSGILVEHGAYDDADLQERISEIDPHIIWFPALVPETFSFTLGAAIATGRPIAASNLGAFSERLVGRPWSWINDWSFSGKQYAEFFDDIRKTAFQSTEPPELIELDIEAPPQDGFYQIDYLVPLQSRKINNARDTRKKVVIVDSSIIPTACGQIRLALPFSHPVLSKDYRVEVLSLEEAMKAKPDAMIVQRVAVPDVENAQRLADHCEKHGTKKIFEIDDDLFALPDVHPEKEVYAKLLEGAEAFLSRADFATVTTSVLAERVKTFGATPVVLPNYLDDRIWFTGARGEPLVRRPGEKLKVAFVGSSTHTEDLDMVAEAVRRVARAKPGQLELHLVGCQLSDASGIDIVSNSPPSHLAGDYVRFVEWLRRSANWHAALAPLISNTFNDAKSPLKFLDYGALGLAGIYSDVPPFRGVVSHEHTGLIVDDVDSWTSNLTRLLEDESFRLEMASNARDEVRNHHTIMANGNRLQEAWETLLS